MGIAYRFAIDPSMRFSMGPELDYQKMWLSKVGNRYNDSRILSVGYFLRWQINQQFALINTIGTGGYIERFYASMKEFACEPTHLALYRPPEGNLRQFVLSQDIFYVGGGNTRNLLILWREWGLDAYLKEAWENGAVLAGISAGSICWFEQGLTDSVTGKLLPLDCLGFIKGSNCPHYDGEELRRPVYQEVIKEGSMLPGIACDDGVAAYFVDGKLEKFVSSRPNAKAYKVESVKGEIEERQIDPEVLNNEV